ncbi:gamma-glutamyltransferase [Leekyejoonella antrihumi]|uniref:Tyramine oxidase n=1 Tax=Leekyejoonella antrihumi TaxID=1660198 RepID=A0A563E490_9MICO|nr:gamma-glutamyltransferase [Leekyejoonella antrihumi]TWP37052.1 tyramine oxidase [Leekyejoonella antrihumi]
MSVHTIAQTGTGWAVSTPHSAATDAAASTFASAGNAVDAALAAAAMLAVVYPNQCSVGGDLIALVGTADGEVHTVNASGRAPRGVDVDEVAASHRFMPLTGALPVTVPGVVSGWEVLSRRWGTKPLSDALAVAEAAARDGVEVSAGLARGIGREPDKITADPGLRNMFQRGGEFLREGATLRQPQLANSLAMLKVDGAAAMYHGELGEHIVAELRARGSAMSMDDFSRHHVDFDHGIGVRFADREYVSTGGNSQGVFFLAAVRALELLRADGDDLDPLGESAGRVAAVLSRAAMDRDQFLGDADVAEWVLSDDHVRSMTKPQEPPRITGFPAAHGDTVGVTTADSDGLWVSLLQSVFHGFGSGILEPRSGIVLHNRGASFTLRDGSSSRLAGGKRPPHTLMPVLVRQDGLIVGSQAAMGGRAQPQIQAHLVLALAAGASAEAAVSQPRWVLDAAEWDAPIEKTSTVLVEQGVPDRAAHSVAAAGFTVQRLGQQDDEVGHAHVIQASRDGSGDVVFEAATDPRADGSALVGRPVLT